MMYRVTLGVLDRLKIHLIRLDAYTRFALIAAGALGAYSLGANNIANVMGVFVSATRAAASTTRGGRPERSIVALPCECSHGFETAVPLLAERSHLPLPRNRDKILPFVNSRFRPLSH